MPFLQLKKVSKRYLQGDQQVTALDQVDFSLQKGDFVCLCGPSGSGKSTLLNLIGAIDRPTSGSVCLDGQQIQQLSKGDLARFRLNNISYVFQSFNLIPVLSAQENVELVLQLQGVSRAERQQRALDALIAVGMGDLSVRKPHQLSGGQQQRVAFARATVSNPRLILADEPTANLDGKNTAALMEVLQALNQESQVSLLIATHDQRVLKYASGIQYMEDGKFV